jgi:Pentapeptide repeats (8 copies)
MFSIALETQRAHETALQNYLEQVGALLIEKPLRRASTGDNLSTVVRAQTLSVLEGLEPDRKGILLRFLYESGLIYKRKLVVSLVAANLDKANLSGADLSEADLSETKLYKAHLSGADLRDADLSDVLRFVNLNYANLIGANLSGANLSNAKGWTVEQLLAAASLKGATMPNGQQYEHWIESREEANRRP